MSFFTGSSEKHKRVPTLLPEQMELFRQLQGAGQGSFGTAADYYRDLLSNDSNTFNQMAAPQLRQFNEDIIPGISEQFAGMGSGGLSSSGFRNAAINAGTDLSERLGSIRAQLRQQGAQGLAGIGQQGLQNYSQDIGQGGTPGLLANLSPAIGTAIGSAAGPFGSAVGGALGGLAKNWISSKGKSSPYGDQANLGNQAAQMGIRGMR